MVTVHPLELALVRAAGATVRHGAIVPRPGERRCPLKTAADLCGVHGTPAQPFGCVASPFTLTRPAAVVVARAMTTGRPCGTLIVRNRYRLLRCYRDTRDGHARPAYRAFAPSLVAIFGRVEAGRICAHMDRGGGDMTAMMPRVTWDMLRDNDRTKESLTRAR